MSKVIQAKSEYWGEQEYVVNAKIDQNQWTIVGNTLSQSRVNKIVHEINHGLPVSDLDWKKCANAELEKHKLEIL